MVNNKIINKWDGIAWICLKNIPYILNIETTELYLYYHFYPCYI